MISINTKKTMNTHSLTLLIFAGFIFLRCLSSTGATTCHPDDEAGLLGFKSGITRDSGILSSWKKCSACCTWDGVICDKSHRVIILEVTGVSDLSAAYLYGTISPLLVKLQHLESISLFSHPKLTGSFPHFLSELPKLRNINLMHNRLSGPLPVNIGGLRRLENLILEGNRFTGSIPVSISNLTRLSELKLGGNRFSGTIPNVFKSMTRLQTLDLSGNRFSGELPPSLSSTPLVNLVLSQNILSGTIPNVFKSMTRLQTLDLSGNSFSGKLPPSLSSSTYLVSLVLSQNKLSGTIPDYISRFKALETLDLSKNRFSGTVPMSFTNLIKISTLDLSHNLLTGSFPALNKITYGIRHLDLSYNQFQLKTIPEWATSSKSITVLKLVKCGIKMSLDDWKPSEMYYEYIDLSENDISGSPTWFFNQENTDNYLLEFRASGNKLRFDMGKLSLPKSLESLDLSRNLVFGNVPATVARLKTLNVSQNHLCGKLPVTKFPASAFAGNDCLCGSPLAPCKA